MAWRIASGLIASMGLLAVGEFPLGELGELAKVGAVGVLAWVAWTQRKEIASLREKHGEIVETLCQRWDSWEKIRHEDHNELNATLAAMRENCAAVLSHKRSG